LEIPIMNTKTEQVVFTIRRSWLSATKRGAFELEREERDLFSGPARLFRSFDAAMVAVGKLAVEESEEEGVPTIFGWVIGDPKYSHPLVIHEVVPIELEANASEGVPPFAQERAKAPGSEDATADSALIPFDGEARP
jgi:hypothetical protein